MIFPDKSWNIIDIGKCIIVFDKEQKRPVLQEFWYEFYLSEIFLFGREKIAEKTNIESRGIMSWK